MTGREVVLKTINKEKTSRIPVVIFSGGAWTFNNRGFTLQEIIGKAELAAGIIAETNERLGSDIVWAGSGFNNLPVRALGGKTKFRAKGTMDVLEPLIEKAADVDRINLDRLKQDEEVRSIYETAALLERTIGRQTLVGGCGWGPFTLGAQFYGVEKIMQGIYKDKPAVHAVLDFAAEASFQYYAPFIEAGAKIISVAEPTASGDMISRNHFEEFTLPYLEKFMKRLKGAGAIGLLHICGDITNRLDLIPASGADVLSVDYKVDLGRVREILGTKMAFAGNVNPVDILVNATPEQVSEVARECIEKAGQDSYYILMPGCDLSPNVPLENLQAMVHTGKDWPVAS